MHVKVQVHRCNGAYVQKCTGPESETKCRFAVLQRYRYGVGGAGA